MATTRIQTGGVTAQSITHDKLHTDMNLSTKTVVLPTISALNVTNTLGLGVTPGVWSVNYPALQIGQGATLTGHKSNTQTQLGQNWWVGTGNQYVVNGSASRLVMGTDSTIEFSQAPSGSAGATMSTINTRLIIKPSGDVGIGTNDPKGKLHVGSTSGTENIAYISQQKAYGTGTGTAEKAKLVLSIDEPGYPANTRHFAEIFTGPESESTSSEGYLAFSTRNGGNATQKMIIDGAGNVGINIPNPSTTLHVGGIVQVVESSETAFYAGNYVRVFGSSQEYGFRNTGGGTIANISMSGNSYFNGGNVGIGTNTPTSKLHVDGPVKSSLVIASSENPIRSSSDADNYFTYTPEHNLSYSTWDFTSDERIAFHARPSYGNSGYLRLGRGTDAHILPEGWTGTLSAYLHAWSGNFATEVKVQTKPLSSTTWTDRFGTGDNGSSQYNQVGSWVVSSALSEPHAVRFYFVQNSGVGSSSGYCSAKNITITNLIDSYKNVNQSITHHNGNIGIGTSSPVAKLHIWNEQGGNATDKATMLSEAVMKLQPHVSNSTNMLFAQVDNGSSMGIQVTNGPATANWDLALSPFGGHVGIGEVSPTRRLSVVGPSGTNVVQSIRNPSTAWSQYALTRYGTEGNDVRYMDFGYYRGSAETNRGLVIKSQANANLVHFLDSGKVGIKTEPIGSFNVVGTSTIYNGYADPDLTVVNGNGHSSAASGEISMVHCFQGTGAANDLFEFQYDATSWKSFGFEIDISTAGSGWGKVQGGGYNNGGVNGQSSITGNIITGFAFDNVSGNSQAHILRCTFGGGVHHTIRVKYWQGGGDGGPRADRATMRFIS